MASMLLLLKPWRSISADLLGTHITWANSFSHFMLGASPRIKNILTNIQYFHECSDGAKNQIDYSTQGGILIQREMEVQRQEQVVENEEERELTEWDVEHAKASRVSSHLENFGMDALAIARATGIFSSLPVETVYRQGAQTATIDDLAQFLQWDQELTSIVRTQDECVFHQSVANRLPSRPNQIVSEAVLSVDTPKISPSIRPELAILNTEQRRVHNIVEDNLLCHLAGRKPPQLLMIVQGQGGTGKSLVIKTISDTFAEHNASEALAKTATSGVVASLIGGQTLHYWAGLGIHAPSSSDWLSNAPPLTAARRKRTIPGVKTLIIDECSMLTKVVFACLSEVVEYIRGANGEGDATKPFGGLNVIMFGDFHQFPPVSNPTGALYHPSVDSGSQPLRQAAGKLLYEQFQTVVILKEQKRVADVVWKGVLDRLREGECTEEDIQEVRKLIVNEADNDNEEFSSGKWDNAVLVTSRHAVREEWNQAAIARHCARTGNRLYICPAEDTEGIARTPLPIERRVLVAGMRTKPCGNLADEVKIAVGMRVMVTLNLSTDKDLANGTRGTIEEIILDPRENCTQPDEDGAIRLSYPPALVLFKPDVEVTYQFDGLRKGLLPICPSERGFTITDAKGRTFRVHRRQLATTPAYAFTDFKSQGQTILVLFIDIAAPPGGTLSNFNAYVALSRGRGRSSIRLLRDFDDALFTTHPSEHLRLEDIRLRRLDAATALLYQ